MADNVVTLKIGLNTTAARAEVQALTREALLAQQANARTVAEMNAAAEAAAQRMAAARAQRDEVAARAQRAVQQEVSEEALRLERKREELVTVAIEDEREKRIRVVELQFAAEAENIERLLKLRLEAGEITQQQFREQQREFDALLQQARDVRIEAVERRFGDATATLQQGSQRAQMTLQSVARTIDSAGRFTVNWQSGLRGVVYQLIPLGNQVRRLREETGGTQTVMQALLAGFRGPAGLVTLLTLAGTAAVLMGSRITKAFRESKEEAERAQKQYEEALAAVVRFENRDQQTFSLGPVGVAREAADAARERDRLNAEVRRLRDERLELSQQVNTDQDLARLRELGTQITRLEAERDTQERRLADANRFLQDTEAQRRDAERRADQGQESNELLALRARLQERLASERERELRAAEQQLEADLRLAGADAGLQTQAREAYRREVAEINKRYDERERKDAERLAKERERTEKEVAQAVFAARLELMAEASARELAQIDAQEAERLRIVAGNAEQEAVVRQAAALRRLEVEAAAEQRRVELAREAAEFEEGIEDRRLLRAAATAEERERLEVEQLERRVARLDEQLAAEEAFLAEQRALIVQEAGVTEAEYVAAIERGIEQLRRSRAEAGEAALDASADRRRREADAEADFVGRMGELRYRERVLNGEAQEAILRERLAAIEAALAAEELTAERRRELLLAEAEVRLELLELVRAQQDRLQQDVERVIGQVLDAVESAILYQRRFSEAAVDETRRRYDEELELLHERYAAGEIEAREYHNRLALMAEERSAFERQVAEDQASAITRIALGTLEVLKSAALDAVKAELAKAAAAQVGNLVRSPLGALGLLAAPAAIAAIFALQGAIRSAAGFASGGLVHGGEQIIRVNERGTEFVMNAEATRGNERGLYALQSTLKRGVRLDDLLGAVGIPAYAEGGLVGATALLSPPPPLPRPAGGDAPALLAELRAMRSELAMQSMELQRVRVATVEGSERVARSVGDPDAARRLVSLGERRTRDLDPRGGRL